MGGIPPHRSRRGSGVEATLEPCSLDAVGSSRNGGASKIKPGLTADWRLEILEDGGHSEKLQRSGLECTHTKEL